MNQKYVDKSGEVRVARELLSMSVEALAGAAQIDPRFVQLVEAKQAVTDGPALQNLFDALERCGQERILQIQSMVPAMARRADEARAAHACYIDADPHDWASFAALRSMPVRTPHDAWVVGVLYRDLRRIHAAMPRPESLP